MKKLFYFPCAMFFALLAISANGQSAIILDKSNISGLGTETIHTHSTVLTGFTSPSTGANQTWDYSSLSGGKDISTNFIAVGAPFSNTAVVDTSTMQSIVKSAAIKGGTVYDIDADGYFIAGKQMPKQAYSDALITGNPKDSTHWDAQSFLSRENLILFPATMGSSWRTSSTHKLNCTITVAAAGLNNAPITFAVSNYTNDTVVGWGTLSIPAGAKPSIPYNVLMIRQRVVEKDSFFLYGSPAPVFLLAGFQSKQNDTTYEDFTESFYRPGFSTPLLTIDYGYDSTYSTPTSIRYDENEIQSSVKNPYYDYDFFKLFPNPAKAGRVNFQIYKNSEKPWKLNIVNALGQNIKTMAVNGNGNLNLFLDMTGINTGLYFVNVTNENGAPMVSSKLDIMK